MAIQPNSHQIKLSVLNQEFKFLPVRLYFQKTGLVDLFALKNNKTLAETLTSRRYIHLAPEVTRRYPNSLQVPLGKFLYALKTNGDPYDAIFVCYMNDNEFQNTVSNWLVSEVYRRITGEEQSMVMYRRDL